MLFGAHEPVRTPLVRDGAGLWSATIGPVAPNLYEYCFDVDGLRIPDTGVGMTKPQR